MTGKANASLSRLFASAKSLNDVSDRLTAQIKDIEAALAANGIGVEGWVHLENWSEQADGYALDYSAGLGYGKHNGKWGLLYSIWCEQIGESTKSFLRDTAREVRISALEKLPDLFDKLSEETQKLTQKATENLSVAQEVASALKTNGRK